MTSNNSTRAKTITLLTFIPGIIWFIFVMGVIFLPGDDVPDEDWLNIADFDKLIHACLFGGIVFFFCFPFKKAGPGQEEKKNLFIRITIATIVWGLATEFI